MSHLEIAARDNYFYYISIGATKYCAQLLNVLIQSGKIKTCNDVVITFDTVTQKFIHISHSTAPVFEISTKKLRRIYKSILSGTRFAAKSVHIENPHLFGEPIITYEIVDSESVVFTFVAKQFGALIESAAKDGVVFNIDYVISSKPILQLACSAISSI